jgi:hypothetical protein
MSYDYSQAPPPRDFELIPYGTIATLRLGIQVGGAGEDGLLKRSAKGDCEMLVVELVVIDGPFARRKFWERYILAGTSDGHEKAAAISRGTLRTILESARGIKPDDLSAQARAARTVSLREFDGMCFVGRIGVEKGKLKNDASGESYPDKNILAGIITPDKRDWHAVDQPAPAPNGGGAARPTTAAPATIAKPSWASQ